MSENIIYFKVGKFTQHQSQNNRGTPNGLLLSNA